MTSPSRAPSHRLYHRNWSTAYIANSTRGAILARNAGCQWIDNDFHLSLHGQAWINAHGAPDRFWLPNHDRFENHQAAELFRHERVYAGRRYKLRNVREAFIDNHHNGLSTEVEVKDVRPWNTPALLDAAFRRMAAHALAVYGPGWQQHVVVKVLTNLGGGVPYALGICAAAHAHGIPTMLLARGLARWNRFDGHPEVTWVRGSLVIR